MFYLSRPMVKFRRFVANWYELVIMTLAILTVAFVTVEVLWRQ